MRTVTVVSKVVGSHQHTQTRITSSNIASLCNAAAAAAAAGWKIAARQPVNISFSTQDDSNTLVIFDL